MSFEPHYINTYIIYCIICMLLSTLILEIYNKIIYPPQQIQPPPFPPTVLYKYPRKNRVD